MKKTIQVKNRIIGDGHPCFIIAEIGMNHNGDMNLAKKIIDAAVDCKVDAVKFQIFTAENLVTKSAETYGNEDGHLPKYQQEMYKKYELTKEQYLELKNYCDDSGIIFFASTWDEDNVDLLDEIDGAIFKFGAADITHLPLLEYAAKKGRPMMISTGMSTLDEVQEAVDAIKPYNDEIMILHCVSAYPAKAEDANIRSMQVIKNEFNTPVGFSDHTPDILTDIVAVAAGANIIEKHFTIDKKIPGVDHHLSFDPKDMKAMVEQVRIVEKMMGTHDKHVKPSEMETRMMARRSVIAKINIPKGTVITKDMLIVKRPGIGMAPKHIHTIVGKKTATDIAEDTVLKEDMFDGE